MLRLSGPEAVARYQRPDLLVYRLVVRVGTSFGSLADTVAMRVSCSQGDRPSKRRAGRRVEGATGSRAGAGTRRQWDARPAFLCLPSHSAPAFFVGLETGAVVVAEVREA